MKRWNSDDLLNLSADELEHREAIDDIGGARGIVTSIGITAVCALVALLLIVLWSI